MDWLFGWMALLDPTFRDAAAVVASDVVGYLFWTAVFP